MPLASSVFVSVCLCVIVASTVTSTVASAPYHWIVQALAWSLMMAIAWTHSLSKRVAWFAIAALVVCVAYTMALSISWHANYISDDVYRYVWDGHMVSHGLNPYGAVPESPENAWLERTYTHTSGLTVHFPGDVKYANLPTIYPPGSQLLFGAISAFAGTNLAMWMLLWQGALVGLAAWLVFALPKAMRTRMCLVLLNPLVLIHGFREPHIDVAMGILLLLAILSVHGLRPNLGGALLGLAMSMKYVTAIYIPLLLAKWYHKKYLTIVVALLTFSMLYIPFLGMNVLGSLTTYGAAFQANSLVAHTLRLFDIHGTGARVVLLCIMVVVSGSALWRLRSNPSYAISTALVAMMCLSPIVHPWYLAIPVLLFVLAPTRAVIVATCTLPLYLVGWHAYKNGGTWNESTAVLAIEWIPIMLAVVADILRPPRYSVTSEQPSA